MLISTLPAHSPAFVSQTVSGAFPVLVVANTGYCVGPQNKVDHPAYRYRQDLQVPVLSDRGV